MEGDKVNEEAPQSNKDPRANQAPVNPSAISDVEVSQALKILSQATTTQDQYLTTQVQEFMTQANTNVGTHVNPNGNLSTSRVSDFARMNPPKFYGSKMEEDPRRFIDKVYKVLVIMRVSPQ